MAMVITHDGKVVCLVLAAVPTAIAALHQSGKAEHCPACVLVVIVGPRRRDTRERRAYRCDHKRCLELHGTTPMRLSYAAPRPRRPRVRPNQALH
ncbi:hypothetical protein F6X42_35585 [Paraburkholderia sp. WC7.3b]|uniref:Uncharacterized protein n=1 Tax=Paraburkholderia podalyriae TaxID=1938811 RepID=A0ABR7PZC6_9BURK|nr:hypothetical protein [Paraburkholderia podalyriae]